MYQGSLEDAVTKEQKHESDTNKGIKLRVISSYFPVVLVGTKKIAIREGDVPNTIMCSP